MFICSECGYKSAKWFGRCPGCGAWNSLGEDKSAVRVLREKPTAYVKPVLIGNVELPLISRLKFKSFSLNEFFGGGLVRASVILLAGEPGIGKSTFLLSLKNFLKDDLKVLFISGEETVYQVADRAKRINVKDVYFVSTNSLETILEVVERESYDIVIIDSIQTVSSDAIEAPSGTPSQVRFVAEKLTEVAKRKDIVMFISGHVTKSGDIAGPKLLEHVVDVVLYAEGDRTSSVRFVKSVKNRFGSTGSVVVFELVTSGVEIIEEPSAFFLSGRREDMPGSVISSVVEGTRSFLVEVQALVSNALYPSAVRRLSIMYDLRRLFFLLAVMERYMGVNLRDKDIYINIPGGIMVKDSSCDLAVVLAIYSSLRGIPVGGDMVVFGEVGLGGELRGVKDSDMRIREAVAMGKRKIVVPESIKLRHTIGNVEIIGIKSVKDLLLLL